MSSSSSTSTTTTQTKASNLPRNKHEERLAEYLDSFISTSTDSDNDKEQHEQQQEQQQEQHNQHHNQSQSCSSSSSFPRVKCCGSSRGLYCDKCQKLLIAPKEKWPTAIQNGTLALPFDLDVILYDRRRSSSGFHAIVLLGASQNSRVDIETKEMEQEQDKIRKQGEKCHDIDGCGRKRRSTRWSTTTTTTTTRLIDIKEGDEIPYYNQINESQNEFFKDKSIQKKNNDDSEGDGDGKDGQQLQKVQDTTFLLFPSEHSIPISRVVSKIKKLVVLDCKWTNTSIIQRMPQLQHENIPHVHLDEQFVPRESYFWRWHNAGNGMCSTLEAIYFAALEVNTLTTRNKFSNNDDGNGLHNDIDSNSDSNSDSDSNSGDHCNLLSLMWLFAIQRSATIRTAKREGKFDPFSVEGKEYQRSLRRTVKGSEKHLRDIEKGKLLKEIHRLENEKNKQKQVFIN